LEIMVSFEVAEGKQDSRRRSEVRVSEALLVVGFPLVALLGWALEGWYIGRKEAVTARGRHARSATGHRCGREQPTRRALRPEHGLPRTVAAPKRS
jgi:hypothetical protein